MNLPIPNGLTRAEIADNLRAWIKELRTTKLEQGANFLCDPKGKHCCLGVAGRVAIKLGYDVSAVKLNDDDCTSFRSTDINGVRNSDDGLLPDSVAILFGLFPSSKPGSAREKFYSQQRYSVLNDDHGLSFAEIADEIERTLLPQYVD